MKKFLVIIILSVCSGSLFGQAKKPTIMIVPSDNWCITNGFFTEFDNQGQKVKVSDYKRALQENADLIKVIASINSLMSERGFPLKNLESVLKSLESQSAEDAMLTSKTGSSTSESPIDKLKKTAKADIWMQLTWTVKTMGPKVSVDFVLTGIDAYTDKQIAGADGTGPASFTADVSTLLSEAVLAHIDGFNSKLQMHFDDMFANGREVILRIKKFDSFDGDLESEYGGSELGSIIESWVSENTVQGRFNTTDATENAMLFEQVRIALYDATNKAQDARSWAKGLQKMLKEKYQIESKLMTRGLGQAQIVIGEK